MRRMSVAGRRRLAVVLASAAGGAVVACSLIAPFDSVQCKSREDCVGRGAQFADTECIDSVCRAAAPEISADAAPDASDDGPIDHGPWGCLGVRAAPADPNSRMDVEVAIVDALQPYTFGGPALPDDLALASGTPLVDVSIVPCGVLDPTCTVPLAPAQTTDAMGRARFSLLGNFDGVFKLSRSDLVPSIVYAGRFIAGDTKLAFGTALPRLSDMKLIGLPLGIEPELDPAANLGHIFVSAHDCDDRFAAGISFSISKDAGGMTTFYLKDGLPSTSVSETDLSGTAGLINVPAGTVEIEARVARDNRLVGSYNVLVRAGGNTVVIARPRVR